eukprot:TRINITY_DN54471_c0_g1_i1.p1 TRINITY_DN54471_c0_g1~~TRINITY_DN54471_c0_g1_i1.p1  ORF type:complete len:163 (-),score=21.24 TRINITY_DN54471_c0_g1_i1:60-512(-)
MIRITVALLLVALSSAHLCLLNPKQRGPVNNLNTAGSPQCLQVQGPCGTVPREVARVDLLPNVTIVFQKNLDHYNPANPGSFVVSIASETDMKFIKLGEVPDAGDKSLTLYTEEISIPRSIRGPAVLQVTYTTNNPQAPPVFYQCADVLV